MTTSTKTRIKGFFWKLLIPLIMLFVGVMVSPLKSAFFNPQTAVGELQKEHKADIEKVNTKIDTVGQHIRLEIKAVSDKESSDFKEVGERSKVNEARAEEIKDALLLINSRLEKISDKLDELK